MCQTNITDIVKFWPVQKELSESYNKILSLLIALSQFGCKLQRRHLLPGGCNSRLDNKQTSCSLIRGETFACMSRNVLKERAASGLLREDEERQAGRGVRVRERRGRSVSHSQEAPVCKREAKEPTTCSTTTRNGAFCN